MTLEPVQPESWAPPRGYSNGILAPAGARVLFVAGQVAWDEEQRLVGAGDFVAQFARALENVVAVVRAAGGSPDHLGRLTIYVVDKGAYLAHTRQLGAEYRRIMGRHFPAMALVQVAGLVEEGALLEIEGTAAIP